MWGPKLIFCWESVLFSFFLLQAKKAFSDPLCRFTLLKEQLMSLFVHKHSFLPTHFPSFLSQIIVHHYSHLLRNTQCASLFPNRFSFIRTLWIYFQNLDFRVAWRRVCWLTFWLFNFLNLIFFNFSSCLAGEAFGWHFKHLKQTSFSEFVATQVCLTSRKLLTGFHYDQNSNAPTF